MALGGTSQRRDSLCSKQQGILRYTPGVFRAALYLYSASRLEGTMDFTGVVVQDDALESLIARRGSRTRHDRTVNF